MSTPHATPKRKTLHSLINEGARIEREAMRKYLQRQLKDKWPQVAEATLEVVLTWVKTRQKRYDKKPGGLGK